MTDIDAESAFLRSMQNDAPAYTNDDQPPATAEEDEADDYDPAILIDAPYEEQEDDPPRSNRTSLSGSMPQSPATPAATTEDQVAPAAPTPEESPVATKQPRTIGGFVVDDDDDEDEIPVSLSEAQPVGDVGMDSTLAPDASNEASRPVSQTPINTLPQAVPLSQAQDQDVSGVDSIGAANSSNLPTVPVETSASTPTIPATSLQSVPASVESADASAAPLSVSTAAKGRLPQDRVGILEDRIAEDPRGDVDAWLNLIAEHRKRGKIDEARAVYERFFKVFPTAADQWLSYANMELQEEELAKLEQIFSKSLASTLNVGLWQMYLDYVRRRNNLTTDASGEARSVINSAYEFVLTQVGIDKDSGKIWQDYLEFLKSGPGTIGGSTWQDQQKMDTLRKAYQRAVCIPTQQLTAIWKQYDAFEMGLNKVTGRKFLQEKSPAFVTARSSNVQLENITRDLLRNTTPRLPPMKGFDGEEEYMKQVEIWRNWINWEKDDPLVLKDEDLKAYKNRVLYVYKQAVMPLRFWPEMWHDAAEWCFQNDFETEGNDFLDRGIAANPENCLLAFKKGDRIELTSAHEDTDAGKIKRGDSVREPYDKLLDSLYALVEKAKARQQQLIENIKERFRQEAANTDEVEDGDDEDEESSREKAAKTREAAQQTQEEAIKRGSEAQIKLIKRTLTFAWIALMRAMRRIQGKGSGKPTPDPTVMGGFRRIFLEARKKGSWTPELWITSALLEHHYKDPAATKIFERAQRLFPDDELFALEYLKHLININDITNARAVFETTVNKMTQKPENVGRAKSLFAFLHEYESKFGELSQIVKLEKRMSDLFPEDPRLANFSHRFSQWEFDPTSIRHVISPSTQVRPKPLPTLAAPTVEQAVPSIEKSPQAPPAQLTAVPPVMTNSPKRPLTLDDADEARPTKFMRGESPLKGAAGRRLDAQRRNQQRGPENPSSTISIVQPTLPAPLPKEINFLLSIIPPAHTYKAVVLDPRRMVELLGNIDLSRANLNRNLPAPPPVQMRPTPSQTPQMPQMPQMPFGAPPYPMPPYQYPR